jgi:hypothetical protein
LGPDGTLRGKVGMGVGVKETRFRRWFQKRRDVIE